MKTRLIILLSVCTTFFCAGAKGQGIEFFQGTFEEGLAAAREGNKMLFIDFYADWCGPCKKMVADVFPDESLGEYFRERIVAMQLNTEAPENQDLVKRFKITSIPTLVFLSPDNKVLSQTSGAMSVDGLMRQAQVASGEAPGFTKLYDQYRSSKNDPAIARQLLQTAPDFMQTLSSNMEHDKWRVRIEKVYKDYIKDRMGPDIINPDDYRIIRVFNPEPQPNDAMAEFIVKNIEQYISDVGTAPAYYVVEYNSRALETYAQAGNMEYKKWLDRIAGDMAPAYATLPKGAMSFTERETYRYDGEYLLFAKKDAKGYIELMNKYIAALGEDADAATYAEATQKLYQAMGNRLNTEMHEQAKVWTSAALQFQDNPPLERINYLVMLGDTSRELKQYEEARKCYNQAFVESYQLSSNSTATMIQMTIRRKLSQLELVEQGSK
ncbi:thioredoxin family protein [Alistipes sp. OttesenSCG-928-B03]|nr:thioredoxin family protein [Alistipes sp. OttesenSCG-928-B03]